MSLRANKVASELRRTLSRPLDEFARDHRAGMLTIANVEISVDLSVAKIFISVFGTSIDRGELLRILQLESFRFKKAMVNQLRLRVIPELRFFVDNSLDDIERINSLLKSHPPFIQHDTANAAEAGDERDKNNSTTSES